MSVLHARGLALACVARAPKADSCASAVAGAVVKQTPTAHANKPAYMARCMRDLLVTGALCTDGANARTPCRPFGGRGDRREPATLTAS